MCLRAGKCSSISAKAGLAAKHSLYMRNKESGIRLGGEYMEFVTAIALILVAFIAYVRLSMDNIQKLTDKVIAKDYAEYKREERADEMQQFDMEIEREFPKAKEAPLDTDYL